MRESLQKLYSEYLEKLRALQYLEQSSDSKDGTLEQFFWWILINEIRR